MIAIDNGLIALVLILFTILVLAALFARAENAKNERYIESLRQLGSRCPDCRGMGFHLWTSPEGVNSAPTCSTCGGTGNLADTPSHLPEEGDHA